MIPDQRLLCFTHGFLDGVELLGHVKARPPSFDHCPDAAQVSLRPFEPLQDLRVSFVPMNFAHGRLAIPLEGM